MLQSKVAQSQKGVSLKQVSELLDKKLAKFMKNGDFEPNGGLVNNQDDFVSTQTYVFTLERTDYY